MLKRDWVLTTGVITVLMVNGMLIMSACAADSVQTPPADSRWTLLEGTDVLTTCDGPIRLYVFQGSITSEADERCPQ